MAETGYVQHPLEPIYTSDTRVLILGTIPSPVSREKQFYYAHPRNRFWPVVAHVFQEKVPTTNDERRLFCYKHHIGLWDVIKSCRIAGAQDASISDIVVQDIAGLIHTTSIDCICTTGTKAYDVYMKHCFHTLNIAPYKLPSPSAANARASFDALCDAYAILADLCNS